MLKICFFFNHLQSIHNFILLLNTGPIISIKHVLQHTDRHLSHFLEHMFFKHMKYEQHLHLDIRFFL
jgi:hypothetical protein